MTTPSDDQEPSEKNQEVLKKGPLPTPDFETGSDVLIVRAGSLTTSATLEVFEQTILHEVFEQTILHEVFERTILHEVYKGRKDVVIDFSGTGYHNINSSVLGFLVSLNKKLRYNHCLLLFFVSLSKNSRYDHYRPAFIGLKGEHLELSELTKLGDLVDFENSIGAQDYSRDRKDSFVIRKDLRFTEAEKAASYQSQWDPLTSQWWFIGHSPEERFKRAVTFRDREEITLDQGLTYVRAPDEPGARPTPDSETGSTVLVVRVSGSLDTFDTVKAFKQTILDEVYKGRKDVLIDFFQCGYLSISGWGFLVSLHKKLNDNDCQLTLIGLQPELTTLLDFTRFGEFLDIRGGYTTENFLEVEKYSLIIRKDFRGTKEKGSKESEGAGFLILMVTVGFIGLVFLLAYASS